MSGDPPDVRQADRPEDGADSNTDGRQSPERKDSMNTYTIRRKQAWGSPQEVETIAARSKAVADSEFPADIRWIRSYVIAEADGTLGSVCVYQAGSAAAIRRHAERVGMPADVIDEVADTVVIRPDPVKDTVAA
jgi:hypothetical protein